MDQDPTRDPNGPSSREGRGTGPRPDADPIPEDAESRRLAAAAYFLVALSGLFLFVWRREDRFVRFHALQSILATAVFWGGGFLFWILGGFPIFGFLYAYLLKLYLFAVFLYWLFLMFRAWQGDWYQIPYLGRFVRRQAA